MKLQALNDNVIIKPDKSDTEDKMEAAGLSLPGSVNSKSAKRGTVVSIGEGKYVDGKLVPLTIAVKDKVIFRAYGFESINADDEEHYIMSIDNIVAKAV